MNKFVEYMYNPWRVFKVLAAKGCFKNLDDKLYLKCMYRATMARKLDLENPQTFNEKLQWLKLYNRNNIYTIMVDKFEVKKYVANQIGEKYVIPTIGVWEKFEDIDFGKLPNQFVLKCTHDSGGLVICKNKNELNIDDAKKKIQTSLKRNYFDWGREWPYKNVKPRIIAEPYLELNNTENIEYKMFSFNGEVKVILVCKGEAHNITDNKRTNDFMDENFQRIPLRILNDNSKIEPIKPLEFIELKELATVLSQGIPHLRVDFYVVNGKIYFGEFTFFHNSGFEKFKPEEYDYIFGKWIKLPQMKIVK